MGRSSILVLIVWLTYANQTVANTNEPAQTPTDNHYWEIITNAFEGSYPQQFQSIIMDNSYERQGILIGNTIPDPNSATWDPEITVSAVNEPPRLFRRLRYVSPAPMAGTP